MSGKKWGCNSSNNLKCILLLPDIRGQVKVMLSIERKELRRYSIWDEEELENQEIFCKGNTKPPSSVVLLYVTEVAATALQCNLRKLGAHEDGSKNTGETCSALGFSGGLSCI